MSTNSTEIVSAHMMQGPSLICDKSSLESLNFDEAVLLGNSGLADCDRRVAEFKQDWAETYREDFCVATDSKSPTPRMEVSLADRHREINVAVGELGGRRVNRERHVRALVSSKEPSVIRGEKRPVRFFGPGDERVLPSISSAASPSLRQL